MPHAAQKSEKKVMILPSFVLYTVQFASYVPMLFYRKLGDFELAILNYKGPFTRRAIFDAIVVEILMAIYIAYVNYRRS